MKYACFEYGGRRHVGVVSDDHTTVQPLAFDNDACSGGIQKIIELQSNGHALPETEAALAITDVTLLAPLPRPNRNVFCVGKNYHDHAHEFSNSGFDSSAAQGAVPSHPIVFSKVPESVIGTDVPIQIDPSVSSAIDYEVELAVIIGQPGRHISKANALNHVWGYTIVNDVTARDLQGRYSQWLIGKSQDTFCPMGPWAVTRDSLDLGDTAVRTFVNGELRQDSNTSLLIFDVPTIIQTISEGITLLPGDVIATGTPAGVGLGFDPPKYLEDGDIVRLEIDRIGAITNSVKAR